MQPDLVNQIERQDLSDSLSNVKDNGYLESMYTIHHLDLHLVTRIHSELWIWLRRFFPYEPIRS